MILLLPTHFNAASPPMERVPYFQQYSFTIGPPLMIPKTQHFDILLREEFFALFIVLHLRRQAVLKTIQLNGQSRHRTVAVEKVFA